MDKSKNNNGEKIKIFRRRISKWTTNHLRDFPWRNTKEPYRILIAEIMLQQTSVKKVLPVYDNFIKKFPNIRKLSEAKLESIREEIYSLGLIYRAENLLKISKLILEEYGSAIPKSKKALLKLPGVGEYIASAIMCFAYDDQIPIIDATINRVYGRFFGFPFKMPYRAPSKEIVSIAFSALPQGLARKFNYGLLDFAAKICPHYNPTCKTCFMNDECSFNSFSTQQNGRKQDNRFT